MRGTLTCAVVMILLSWVAAVEGERLPQCICNDFLACWNATLLAAPACFNSCQNFTTVLDNEKFANLKKCVGKYNDKFLKTVECVFQKYNNSCRLDNSTEPKMLDRPNTFAMNLDILTNTGVLCKRLGIADLCISNSINGINFDKCMSNCILESAVVCKNLNCLLELPSIGTIFEDSQKCAVTSGEITVADARGVCECAKDAGVRYMNNRTCGKISFGAATTTPAPSTAATPTAAPTTTQTVQL